MDKNRNKRQYKTKEDIKLKEENFQLPQVRLKKTTYKERS